MCEAILGKLRLGKKFLMAHTIFYDTFCPFHVSSHVFLASSFLFFILFSLKSRRSDFFVKIQITSAVLLLLLEQKRRLTLAKEGILHEPYESHFKSEFIFFLLPFLLPPLFYLRDPTRLAIFYFLGRKRKRKPFFPPTEDVEG